LVVLDAFNEAETVRVANEVPKFNCIGTLDATTSSLSELTQYILQNYEVEACRKGREIQCGRDREGK
jgi:hypothetical protein